MKKFKGYVVPEGVGKRLHELKIAADSCVLGETPCAVSCAQTHSAPLSKYSCQGILCSECVCNYSNVFKDYLESIGTCCSSREPIVPPQEYIPGTVCKVAYNQDKGFWVTCVHGTLYKFTIGTTTTFVQQISEMLPVSVVYEWRTFNDIEVNNLKKHINEGTLDHIFNVVWEAPLRQETQELTVAEISKRLGYPVKVVEG